MEKPKILIIDDDESIRTQMKWGLIGDYDIYLAMDAASAMELIKTERPPLVTLDLPPDGTMVSKHVKLIATATTMRDGGILHLGGTLFDDPIIFLASMDIYSQVQNPYGSYFQVFHVLTDPRTGHTATVLDDGSTLIAGGMNVDPQEPELNSALIFRQRD